MDTTFFEHELAENNFIFSSVTTMLELIFEFSNQEKLHQLAKQLETIMQTKFLMKTSYFGSFDLADDNHAPVFVSPDEVCAKIFILFLLKKYSFQPMQFHKMFKTRMNSIWKWPCNLEQIGRFNCSRCRNTIACKFKKIALVGSLEISF